MSIRTIRDPYGNTFEVDETALPFWERRTGYEILPASEDAPEPSSGGESTPDVDPPKTIKRAARAAQEVKEQPDG